MSAVPGHQDLFTDSCSFTLHSSTNTNYKGCSHVCACYLITVNKEFSLFSNSKEKTTSCDLLHGFATSHKVFSFCSRMYVEQPGKQPAPQESCGLPCPAPLQDENKPLQLFCPLFLAPLACSERELVLMRPLFPSAITVEEKHFKVLGWAWSMSLSSPLQYR